VETVKPESSEIIFQAAAAIVSLGGIFLAYLLFYRKISPAFPAKVSAPAKYFRGGWGFDTIYDTLLARPFSWLATINRNDVIDHVYTGISRLSLGIGNVMERTQNGRLGLFVVVMTAGLVIILLLLITV
jgi:NADH-quinone oxidoreductase subunit L